MSVIFKDPVKRGNVKADSVCLNILMKCDGTLETGTRKSRTKSKSTSCVACVVFDVVLFWVVAFGVVISWVVGVACVVFDVVTFRVVVFGVVGVTVKKKICITIHFDECSLFLQHVSSTTTDCVELIHAKQSKTIPVGGEH